MSSIIATMPEQLELGARDFAYSLSNIAIAALLTDVAVGTKLPEDERSAQLFFE